MVFNRKQLSTSTSVVENNSTILWKQVFASSLLEYSRQPYTYVRNACLFYGRLHPRVKFFKLNCFNHLLREYDCHLGYVLVFRGIW